MIKLTIAAGVLAAIALLLPQLVAIGFFLLVLPGLFLAAMPTLFLYLATATALRAVLPFGTGMPGTLISLVLASALGWLVVQPFRLADLRRYHAAILPEVVPAQPLALSGWVRIEQLQKSFDWRPGPLPCDALCAVLLAAPGVTGVTLAVGANLDRVTSWRLVPRGSVPDTGLSPVKPGDIIDSDPRRNQENPGWQGERDAAAKAIAAEWALRLATSATLVADTAPSAPDFTIAMTDKQARAEPQIQRTELRDRTGKTLLRRSVVAHRVIAAPLYFNFADFMISPHFEIGWSLFSTGGSIGQFRHVEELLRNVAVPVGPRSSEAAADMRRRLEAALDTPDGQPGDLALARTWVASLGYQIKSDADIDLFRRIVADQRIADIGAMVRQVYEKQAPVELRPALAARIVSDATSADDRRRFARLLAGMPAGTFARMTADEQRIINNRQLRQDAAPFIERLADSGPAGLEPLLTVLRIGLTEPAWPRRQHVMRAVCRGLTRMGPGAAPAIPEVRDLFERRPRSPIMNDAGEAFAWRVAMARMGVPVAQLPFPPGWTASMIAEETELVRRRVEAYDPDKGD